VANLQGLLPHDNALDQELQDRLFILEGGISKAGLNAFTKGGEVGQDGFRPCSFLPESGLLILLFAQPIEPFLKQLASLGEFLQVDDSCLIGVQEPAVFALHSPDTH
jgi:hypothetical protein